MCVNWSVNCVLIWVKWLWSVNCVSDLSPLCDLFFSLPMSPSLCFLYSFYALYTLSPLCSNVSDILLLSDYVVCLILFSGCLCCVYSNMTSMEGFSSLIQDDHTSLWKYVTEVEKVGRGGENWRRKCSYCGSTFSSSYSRVKDHLMQISGVGIKMCQ